jgi:hypothetical protein
MSREGLVIDNFSGGLNNTADPALIAENELAEVTNLVLSRTGKLISRPPFTLKAAFPTGETSIKMLNYFRNQDGVVFAVVAGAAKTYLYNIVAGGWTQIWGYAAEDTTTYLNRLYLISSTNGGGYWSKVSSTYTFTTIAAMPNGNQIHFTKGRLYISSRATSNTSTLRYSNITSISAGTSIDEFPAANFIDVNEGDGQLLVKIIEGNSELFLFRTNSTWRLSFGASAEPTDGTLSTISWTVGADNTNCVVEGENYLAVLHAGTAYQLAGYNYYPLNEYNKVNFKTNGTGHNVPTALSKVGAYLIVWFHGSMYCYDTESKVWTEFKSNTKAAHFIEAPRGTLLDSDAAITAYGVAGQAITGGGLLKFSEEFTDAPSEEIVCSVKTKTYDINQPSQFKRLFGWELLVIAVNWVEAGINPIDTIDSPSMYWTELDDYTWTQAQFQEIPWAAINSAVPVIVGGLPNANPLPQVVKVSGKQTFKRAFFTVSFRNDGSKATAPSRLDGIVLYLTNGRRIAMGKTA